MFDLYGVGRDGTVYHSGPPRRNEVDILEVVNIKNFLHCLFINFSIDT